MGKMRIGPCDEFDPQPLTKQWLARIGDFCPLRASVLWVMDVGIKKCCRSTVSRTPNS